LGAKRPLCASLLRARCGGTDRRMRGRDHRPRLDRTRLRLEPRRGRGCARGGPRRCSIRLGLPRGPTGAVSPRQGVSGSSVDTPGETVGFELPSRPVLGGIRSPFWGYARPPLPWPRLRGPRGTPKGAGARGGIPSLRGGGQMHPTCPPDVAIPFSKRLRTGDADVLLGVGGSSRALVRSRRCGEG
jgi:hypothetical protein